MLAGIWFPRSFALGKYDGNLKKNVCLLEIYYSRIFRGLQAEARSGEQKPNLHIVNWHFLPEL